jgi:RNA polymerase-interacting CarD/CdnL/TRCF family regulator
MPDRNTMWTPVEAQVANGLRLVTAKSDLDQYRDLLKSPPVSLNNDHPQRYLELVSRLKQGSFQVTCEVVRDLTLSDWQKPLGITNKTILRKTQQRLYQEWASAADISIAEATKEIDTLLQATQKATLN